MRIRQTLRISSLLLFVSVSVSAQVAGGLGADSRAAPAATAAAPVPSAAQPASLTVPELIGLKLFQVFDSLGSPQQVYPIRGNQPWMDDVVFFYASHVYLYWYENRVWQVRFDKDYRGSFLSLSIGETREKARSELGAPLESEADWDLFQLADGTKANPDRGFPIRVRLFYDRSGISEAYIYRGDF